MNLDVYYTCSSDIVGCILRKINRLLIIYTKALLKFLEFSAVWKALLEDGSLEVEFLEHLFWPMRQRAC